jgi:hypothetical protein
MSDIKFGLLKSSGLWLCTRLWVVALLVLLTGCGGGDGSGGGVQQGSTPQVIRHTPQTEAGVTVEAESTPLATPTPPPPTATATEPVPTDPPVWIPTPEWSGAGAGEPADDATDDDADDEGAGDEDETETPAAGEDDSDEPEDGTPPAVGTATASPTPTLSLGIVASNARLRSEPALAPELVMGQVCTDDQVTILEEQDIGTETWARIRVVATAADCAADRVGVDEEGWLSRRLLAAPSPQAGDTGAETSGDGAAPPPTPTRVLPAVTSSSVQVVNLNLNEWLASTAVSPDGQRLAGGAMSGRVLLWNISDRQVVRVFEGLASKVRALTFSPDGQLLAAGTEDGHVRVWNTETGAVVQALQATDIIFSVAISPGNDLVAYGGSHRAVWVAQLSDGAVRFGYRHDHTVNTLVFSPGGQLLASGASDDTLKLVQVSDGTLVGILSHPSWVLDVEFSPDGGVLATAAGDGALRVWRSDGSQVLHTMQAHDSQAVSVAFSTNGQWLASAGLQDSRVRLWRVSDGRVLGAFQGEYPVQEVAFSADGGTLIATTTGALQETARLWVLE